MHAITHIDSKALGGFSPLYEAFIAAAGLPPFLETVAGDAAFWRVQAGGVDASGGARARAVADVRRFSEQCGTAKDLLDVLDPATPPLFVVTGQQPGLLGGPLHTAHKVATAIALANRLQRHLSRPVVPLYWCGADDTDFAEIRNLVFVADGVPVKTSIPQDAHRGGLSVGDIDIGAIDRVWRGVRDFVSAPDPRVAGIIDGLIASSPDHGVFTASLLVHLFEGRVAAVDGRSAAVRQSVADVLESFVRDEDEVKTLVRAGGEQLAAQGYHVQLEIGEGSGVFLMDGGLRKSVGENDRDRLLDAIRNDAASCAPGVVARNLVQDAAFTPIAAVLGPAELAYRAQIGSVYELLSVRRPVNVPRFSGTYLPPEIAGLVAQGTPTDAEVLLRDPAGFKTHLIERALPTETSSAITALRQDVHDALERFYKDASSHVTGKFHGKLRGRIAEVEKRVDAVTDTVFESGKAIARERWPFIADVESVVRPGGKLQERTVSVMLPFVHGGTDAASGMIALADVLDDLVDGRQRHTVYSG